MKTRPVLVLVLAVTASTPAAAGRGDIVATVDSGFDAASGLGWDGSYLWITHDKTAADLRASGMWKFDPTTYQEVCHRQQVFGDNNKGFAFTGIPGQFWTTRFQFPILTNDDLVLMDTYGVVVRAFPAIGNVGGIAYDPVTTHLIQVDNHSTLSGGDAMDGDVYVLNSTTGAIVKGPISIPVKKARGVTWDGTHLWVISNQTDSAYRINLSDGTVVSQFFIKPVGGTVEGVTFDGACLWITENAADKIYRVDHGQADLPACTTAIPNAGTTQGCFVAPAQPDAGPDAGAGVPPMIDAGAPGVTDDAGDPVDPTAPGGCGCSTGGRDGGFAVLMFAIVALRLARRRNRRPSIGILVDRAGRRLAIPSSALALVALLGVDARANPGDIVSSFPSPTQAPYYATYPLDLAYDGTNLYIANIPHAYDPNSPGRIYSVDPTTGAVRGQFDYESATGGQTLKQLTWSPGALWSIGVTSINGDLTRTQTRKRTVLATGAVVNAYATQEMSRGIAWDAACDGMWDLAGKVGPAQDQPTTEVHLRNASTGASTYSFSTVSTHDGWYSLAHDGCSLWTIDYVAAQLVRLDIATGAELTRLPTPGAKSIGLTFDGSYLLVSDQGTDQIYRVEIGPAVLATGSCKPSLASPTCFAPGHAPPPDPEPDPEPPGGDDDPTTDPGGCASGSGGSGSTCLLIVIVVGAARRRRD